MDLCWQSNVSGFKGLLVLVAGVCVFVLFQIQASGPAIARQYFTVYYAFYVAALPAMSLACLAGTAIHGLEERELDTLKNPTRSLDVVLLMGTALGQMGISYFSIVAWRRSWQPTPVVLPLESPGTEKPGGQQSVGSQGVRHDWVTNTVT